MGLAIFVEANCHIELDHLSLRLLFRETDALRNTSDIVMNPDLRGHFVIWDFTTHEFGT